MRLWIPIPLASEETDTPAKRVAAIASILRAVWRDTGPDAQRKVDEIRAAVMNQVLARGWSPILEDLRADLQRDLCLADEASAVAMSEEAIWDRARQGLPTTPPNPGAFCVSWSEFRDGVATFLGCPEHGLGALIAQATPGLDIDEEGGDDST